MAWESALLASVRTIRALQGLDLSRRIDRVKIDNALQTLRQIFFYSSELNLTLEQIERGESVENEIIDYFADEFYSVPGRIREALSFLDQERLIQINALRIDQLELIRQIRYGKIDLRREVSHFFRAYRDRRDRLGNSTGVEAARVLGQIERFNSAIKELEEKLLQARQNKVIATIPTPRKASKGRKPKA